MYSEKIEEKDEKYLEGVQSSKCESSKKIPGFKISKLKKFKMIFEFN
jgi:hypothetical protein